MPYHLRMFDLVMLVISLVIGMGIFRTPATVAAKAGSEGIFYLAWLAGGVIALCGALTFAEIGRRVPRTGAYYRVFAQAYHPLLAFGVNVIIVVSNAASAAGVSIIGAEYLRQVWPDLNVVAVACAFIAMLFAINLAGLRASVTMQNVLIGIKLVLLCAIILTPLLTTATADLPLVPPTSGASSGWLQTFGVSLIAVAFTYGGYQQTINFGGESTTSGTSIVSRAILVGVVIITALYLLATWAYVETIGFEQLGTSSAIASMVVERLAGPIGSKFVSAAMLISVFGYVNVSMLSNPRVVSAMAEDGMISPRLAQSDAQASRGVNGMTLSAYAALMMVCVIFGQSFEKILNYTIFLDCIGMATAAGALFLLRPDRKISTVVAITAVIFIASYLFIAAIIYLDDPTAAILGLALLASVMLGKRLVDSATGWQR